MSNLGTDARERTASSLPQRQATRRLALVASGEPHDTIAAILERSGLDFEAFPDVDTFHGHPSELDTELVVLWIEDTGSGLAASLEPVTRTLPQRPVVVTCPEIEPRGVRTALAAGATGVVESTDLEAALVPCIHAVLAGQACVPRAHWRQIEPPALSSREKQILGLVVMGYTNGQIARQLFLAESTVKSHLSSAFGKLGVRSRNEAVGLIVDPDRGLGMGILALVGEPIDSNPPSTR
jgi:DNA-binding NarL/FixJ family response regulator